MTTITTQSIVPVADAPLAVATPDGSKVT